MKIAIFGGTFDPIHQGHIQTNLCIQAHFHFDLYFFLPCKVPTIKPPSVANIMQRIEMLELVIKQYPQFQLDLREINRNSPSHMAETLESFRAEYKKASITLILGYDSFISLPQWDQWEKLINFANLLVINRNPLANDPLMPEVIKKFLVKHQTVSKEDLVKKNSGLIYLFDAGQYDISSTRIRKELKKDKEIKQYLTKEVYEYIKLQGLYQ